MRGLLLTTLALSLLIAGCAEGPLNGPRSVPSATEAATLFAEAAAGVPDRYGLKMTMTKETELMSAEAVFDKPAQIAYFKIKMDPTLMAAAGGIGGMGSPSAGENGEVTIYATPQGTAFQVDNNVVLGPAQEGTDPWTPLADDNEGFQTFTDPEAFLAELRKENITVTSVTPTTLRGKPALQLEATSTDEDGTHPLTIYLFQEPTRIARIEMIAPPTDDKSDAPFVGAQMTMDMLYDDEIDIAVPTGLPRALGLFYESDRNAFTGGSDGTPSDETWTFQTAGGIALADVHAEVADAGAEDDAEPLWTMPLADGTKTVDALTLTYQDADADGTVSPGDTLTIRRGEGAEGARVSLRDLVSGLRVTPGPGGLVALLALAGVALAARRA